MANNEIRSEIRHKRLRLVLGTRRPAYSRLGLQNPMLLLSSGRPVRRLVDRSYVRLSRLK